MSATVPVAVEAGVHPALLARRFFANLLAANWFRYAEFRAIAYACFAAVYILPNIILAREKLIWDDEFFTLYLSKTTGWRELWTALSTGADQHPPSFYYLTHLIFKFAGSSHVTLRLTGLLGFALACLCLYEIVRKLMGARWAFAALFAPLTTPLLYYATEARGYGLELGLVSFSLLMWISSEGPRRRWTVPALAISLCLAVSCHYYAILFVLPLAAGEAVKCILRRRIDIPVCSALMAAVLPLVGFAPIISKAQLYSAHFWAVPFWGSMLQWYREMLGRMPLVLLAAAGLAFAFRFPEIDDPRIAQGLTTLPIAVAISVCALLPAVGGLLAKLVTHAFTGRYFIAALPGAVVLLLWAARRVMRNDFSGPALASAICLVLFVQQWRDFHLNNIVQLRQIRSEATLLRHSGDAPIVVSEVTILHQLSFYGRRDLASRLVYLADPYLSVRYIGHDTIDRGLLALVPWFPLKIMWWDEWWRTHPFSLVYGYVGAWTWSTFALDKVGSTELLARDVDHLLLSVTRTKVPENDHKAGDPVGRPLLYDKLPQGGFGSLCALYLPDESCPVVDDPRFKAPIISYPDTFY